MLEATGSKERRGGRKNIANSTQIEILFINLLIHFCSAIKVELTKSRWELGSSAACYDPAGFLTFTCISLMVGILVSASTLVSMMYVKRLPNKSCIDVFKVPF